MNPKCGLTSGYEWRRPPPALFLGNIALSTLSNIASSNIALRNIAFGNIA
jgi:hypothetical protein